MAGVAITAHWVGWDDVLREVAQWDGAIAWADGELKRLAEQIAQRARELVPVDTGALLGTIRVEQPRKRGRFVAGWAITAGGSSAPYAIYVHEDLAAYHDQGQAKFIESAAVELAAAWQAQVDDIKLAT